MRNKIEQQLGARSGVESVFADAVWDERVKRLSRHGTKLNLGGLVMGYIDIRKIVTAFGEHPGGIIIPLYKGRRGHPTLFPRTVIDEVVSGRNLREVITGHRGEVLTIEVHDEGVVLDLDTPEEYERVKGRFI